MTKCLLACSVTIGVVAQCETVLGKEMRWQPVAASGNVICLPGNDICGDAEIILSAGGVTVTLFLEISGWDTADEEHPGNTDYFLGAYQGTVDSRSYKGGQTGYHCATSLGICDPLDPAACDSGNDGACEALDPAVPENPGTTVGLDVVPVGSSNGMGFEGAYQALKVCTSDLQFPIANVDFLSVCTGIPGECGAFPAGCIDRPDFVYYLLDETCTVSTATDNYSWSCASTDCREDPRDGTRFYGGTLLLDVPNGATGTYNVAWFDDVNFTLMNSCPGPLMPGMILTPGKITLFSSRCCYGIGTEEAACEDGISSSECNLRPRGRKYEVGKTCDDPCPLCLSDNRCSDPTAAQDPSADNLCTDDTCEDGVCVFTPNYNVETECCDPDVGPPGGVVIIDDGDACMLESCDPDTGIVNQTLVDCDGDGVCDTEDNCPTVPNASQSNADGDVYGDACNGPFNADHDGDTDLFDVADFVGCMSGPVSAATAPCYDIHDFNGGLRVDIADLATLQRVFTGSIVSPCD